MTQGIGVNGARDDATTATTSIDGALHTRVNDGVAPPTAADFVKVEDPNVMVVDNCDYRTNDTVNLDALKGVSPSSVSSSSCVNGNGAASANALYHQQSMAAAAAAAASFQPQWPNIYSSQAALNAMYNWPQAHCSTIPPQFPNYGANMSKKGRQTYSRQQTAILEQWFQKNRYVNRKQREQLQQETKLSDRQIKIWFQNRRMKEKKENSRRDEHGGEQTTPLTANPPSKPGGLSAADAMLHHPGMPAQHHLSHQHHTQSTLQQRPAGQATPSHLACEMSPMSLNRNLVSSLSLNGMNASGGDPSGNPTSAGLLASIPPTDLAPNSSAAATAVANIAAGIATGIATGGLMSSNVHNHASLFNTYPHMQSHNLANFSELADSSKNNNNIGVIDDDKPKSTNSMGFGVLPNVSNQPAMAAMWSGMINTGGNNGNGMMIPAMSSASTPMSASSGGGGGGTSTPFALTAMLTTEQWWPHQLAPQGMPVGMMQASNNNGLGSMHSGSHYLYPTNV